MMLKKIALGVRYDGAAYHGWQSQQGGLATVQDRVQRALSRVANHDVVVTCAGRTDAGVHATAQVIHFNTEAERTDHAWVFGANSNLPGDISISFAQEVSHEFHARFSATARRYRYVLFNHDVRPGILQHGVGWYYRPLDETLMQTGANFLLGEQDFSSFRGASCQAKSPVRTMHSIDISRRGRMIVIEVQANAFLLHMVRNIVGSLIEVGAGRQKPEWIREILQSCDRRNAGATISPNGLYLVEVDYPDAFAIPRVPVGPFFLA